MRYLSACAIFKNEAPYLEEWLGFHHGVGIEHFYLYDNESSDDFRTVLVPWLATGRVTLYPWPHHPGQLQAYGHCLDAHRRNSRWIAFLDLDEFLFSPAGDRLPPLLAAHETDPAVGANWVVFGSNGHATRPAGLVTRSYLRRADLALRFEHDAFREPGGDPSMPPAYRPYCCHIKSIVNPLAVTGVRTPHSFAYAGGAKAVDESGGPIGFLMDAMSERVSIRRLRVNHYWSRSLAELEAKARRGRATGKIRHDLAQMLAFERRLNEVEDRTILPLVDRIFGPAPAAARR